jgi:hypothetical protein
MTCECSATESIRFRTMAAATSKKTVPFVLSLDWEGTMSPLGSDVLAKLSSKLANPTYKEKTTNVSWEDFIKSRIRNLGDEGIFKDEVLTL